jgi:hypothetical protein
MALSSGGRLPGRPAGRALHQPKECAIPLFHTLRDATMGLDPRAKGLIAWDVFDAVLTPGDIILLVSWRDQAAAEAFESRISLQDGSRLRRVRVVRDYGMFDRREAPQYYPDVKRADTVRP